MNQNRHPYVLVLIDGNDYIVRLPPPYPSTLNTNQPQFNDELIRDKEEGGMRAARLLNQAVETYLEQSIPTAKKARVIVRVYADLTNLSKNLAKTGALGYEKRSLAPFSAAFTRAFGLFDFVDALDEEGVRGKIRGMCYGDAKWWGFHSERSCFEKRLSGF